MLAKTELEGALDDTNRKVCRYQRDSKKNYKCPMTTAVSIYITHSSLFSCIYSIWCKCSDKHVKACMEIIPIIFYYIYNLPILYVRQSLSSFSPIWPSGTHKQSAKESHFRIGSRKVMARHTTLLHYKKDNFGGFIFF